MQVACSPSCALQVAKKVREIAAKKEAGERREKAKTRRELLAEAQKAFNAFIRVRDEGKPCISCGAMQAAQWDAGHYRTVGSSSHLRFNEDNAHRQCSRPCNKDRSGDLINYRKGLIARIGIERVEALENDCGTVVRLSIEDINAIKAKYLAKTKELRRARQ